MGSEMCIRDRYRTEEYEEIKNERLFTTEGLFGQVGGFVGIMLGVSFFQIPDILMATFVCCRKKYRQIMRNESETAVQIVACSMQPTQDNTVHANQDNAESHVSLNFEEQLGNFIALICNMVLRQ